MVQYNPNQIAAVPARQVSLDYFVMNVAHGVAALEQATNNKLQSVRVQVEWMFGADGTGLKSNFKLLSRRMPVKTLPIGALWRAATLLKNMRTVMDGFDAPNEVTRALDNTLDVTLEDYIAGNFNDYDDTHE